MKRNTRVPDRIVCGGAANAGLKRDSLIGGLRDASQRRAHQAILGWRTTTFPGLIGVNPQFRRYKERTRIAMLTVSATHRGHTYSSY